RPAESLLGCRLVDLLARQGRPEAARRLRQARTARDGEAIVEFDARVGTRLAHVRCHPDREADGDLRTHWTLSDMEHPLFESETATAEDGLLARRWLGIYGELVSVTESLLGEALDRAEGLSRPARAHVLESQVRPLEIHLQRLRQRRDHWARRHAEVVGLQM